MTQQPSPDRRWVGGAVLIIIGVALLVGQFLPDVEIYAPLAVGLALLAIFLVTRNPGALIAGCIVTGIGAGVVMDKLVPIESGSWVPLTLGFGFLAIWFIGALFRMPEGRFWPLIPGGILVFAGLAAVGGAAADLLRYAWPIGLIVLGLAVMLLAWRRRQPPPLTPSQPVSTSQEPPPTP